MLPTSETAIRAVAKTDPTIDAAQIEAAIAVFSGKAESRPTTDEGLRRGQVAKMLNLHPQTISRYARAGLIHPLRAGAGRSRATLYSRRSVEAFLRGEATKEV